MPTLLDPQLWPVFRLFYVTLKPETIWLAEHITCPEMLPITFSTREDVEQACRTLKAAGLHPIWIEDGDGRRVLERHQVERL